MPQHRFRRSSVLALALAAAAAAAHVAAGAPAERRFAVAPPPAWVDLAEPPDAGDGHLSARAGVLDLLDDAQQRVGPARTECFYRHVTKVLSTAGLEVLSQISFDFDPSYERLTIHYVRILRNGRAIDALDAGEVNVLQKEDELDEQLYNGMLSAIVFLEDLRPGDVVDYAFSVEGSNPVFGGRYADSFDLDAAFPIRALRRRLLWPEGRPLDLRYTREEVRPTVRALDGEVEYLWERRDVPAVDDEENAPSWYLPGSHVLASEYGSWAEVVQWALPLYDRGGALTPEMAEQVVTWRAQHATEEARFLAALRFVQDEVRYLGIELGAGTHRPAPPGTCFARRFGDCKDKSLLLVTLLGALGVEAYPALVHTELGPAIDGWPPSPLAFDHVVVRATVGNRTVWVDPTLTQQRGRVDRLAPLPYARALVVREGSSALEAIPSPAPSEPTTVVEQVYTAPSWDAPATLEVATTYRGADADEARYELSQSPTSEVARRALNEYAEIYPEIEEDGQLEVRDDESENVVTVSARYRVLNFWRDGERDVPADLVLAEAAIPRGGRRAAPLAVPYPVDVAQKIELRLPEPIYVDGEKGTVSSGAVELDYERSSEDGVVRLEYRYRTLADNVAPAKVSEHIGTLEKIHRHAGYRVSRGEMTAGEAGVWTAAALAGVVVFPLAAGAVLLRRRRARRWQHAAEALHPAPARGAGAGPETAISVDGRAAVDRYLARQRCSCGASLAARGRDGLTYDGRRLTVVGLDCPACGASRDVYFAGADA